MKILIKWATLTLAIYLIASYTGYISIADPKTAILAAAVLGILNALIRPILKILTFPLTVLTLGLFTFVVNGFILMIVPRLIDGFSVFGFWYGVLASLLISIITAALNWVLVPKDD